MQVAKVLIVEDDSVLRTLTADMLKMIGVSVYSAATLGEAEKIYRLFKQEISLVILDMHLEDESGIEVLNMLKEINPEVRAILASGIVMDYTEEELLAFGFIDYIEKPYRMRILHELVKKYI